MNSLVKVFSNFKEFYNEINGATLTGAIDVIVVEQEDGTFVCSPFHVRFGKLGVLRSREKIVDIEINGEPVDIHMKLGESGEAFFIEEHTDTDDEDDENQTLSNDLMNESQIDDFSKYDEHSTQLRRNSIDGELPVLQPRRNSIDCATENDESEKKFENQVSDFKHRRHTDNFVTRRDLSVAKKEFTTQKLRQEWAEHEQDSVLLSAVDNDTENTSENYSKCDKENEFEALDDKSMTNQSIGHVQCDDKENISKTDEPAKYKKRRRRKSSLLRRKSTLSASATFPQLHAAKRKDSSSSSDSIGHSESNMNTAYADDTDADLSFATISNQTALSTPNISPKYENKMQASKNCTNCKKLNEIHFFSDTEMVTCNEHKRSRPSTPIKSDSEIEMTRKKNDDGMSTSASWKWGELPTPTISDNQPEPLTEDAQQAQRRSMISNVFNFMKQNKNLRNGRPTSSQGIYLSDLDVDGLDPEVEALYFPPISPNHRTDPDDHESGNGTSLPHSPSSIESPKSCESDGGYDDGKPREKAKVELSLCGGLEGNGPNEKEFSDHLIEYSEVCQNPNILCSPSLVVRINSEYYDWRTACSIVVTSLAFRKPLPVDAIEQLKLESKIDGSAIKSTTPESNRSSWWYWRRTVNAEKPNVAQIEQNDFTSRNVGEPIQMENVIDNNSPKRSPLTSEKSIDSDISCEKYKKSLRLTSDQIVALNLKDGMNEIVFSVTTAYQGTSRCKCYLFRWKYNDKVVISDIDGTITKSDVLGHILPMVGRDWAQLGVAQLFSKIADNGYKLLYLSARAIGQSRVTREYLRSIRQGDVKLPDGPLLLNPTSLISAFHREVIERKPEQFKIACLSDIQALFPQNPFYAGYGNRINDVWAYRAVGIPIMRIFTINPKGELKHELTQTFQSSYCSMTFIVDHLFPPYNGLGDSNNEFTNVNYWRDPVPELIEDMLTELGSHKSSDDIDGKSSESTQQQ